MECLWDATTPLTVRDVHEQLATRRDIAYTTVMTVLDRLAKKELVTRERVGRAWQYRPATSREELTAQALRTTLEADQSGDREAVLLHFVGSASADELAALRAALAAVERQRKR